MRASGHPVKHLHLPTTPSTMEEARRLIAAGDETTAYVLTDAQTSGRGRQGASWVTLPAPHGMACTFILRPQAPVPHLSLLISVAMRQALSPLAPRLAIKWPNDMLLDGRKVAGILCESFPAPSGATVYLAGIGLNLTSPPQGTSPDFPGTFLLAEGQPQSPVTSHQSLANTLNTCILNNLALYKAQGWGALHQSYLNACTTIGQPARWKRAGKQDLTGIARGLTKDGHLELETDDGQTHIIHSGDIVEDAIPPISPK